MTRKLFAMTPFSLDMNLGAAYNEAMELLPDGAWAALLDHDIAFTTKLWYRQLQEAIAAVPQAGAITAVTNRIAAPWQRVGTADWVRCDEREAHNMADHYALGASLAQKRTLLDITRTKGFGGVVICLSKDAWRRAGGFADGLLCVDHSIHFRLAAAGYRNYLHEGLYVYHRRRAFGGELPKGTPRAQGCPCSGREEMPTLRITIPDEALP